MTSRRRPVMARMTEIWLTSISTKLFPKIKTTLWIYQPSSKKSKISTRLSPQSLPILTHQEQFSSRSTSSILQRSRGRGNPRRNPLQQWWDAAAPPPTALSIFTPGRLPICPDSPPLRLSKDASAAVCLASKGDPSPEIASRPPMTRYSVFTRIRRTRILEHICMVGLKRWVSGNRYRKRKFFPPPSYMTYHLVRWGSILPWLLRCRSTEFGIKSGTRIGLSFFRRLFCSASAWSLVQK